MDPWQKESLNLQVGDFIVWQDEAIEVEGQPAVLSLRHEGVDPYRVFLGLYYGSY